MASSRATTSLPTPPSSTTSPSSANFLVPSNPLQPFDPTSTPPSSTCTINSTTSTNPQSALDTRLRIRNNQRRARARQKEYIHDLESRLRAYERKGVEASIEIQAAARKVGGENERLRGEVGRLAEEVEGLKVARANLKQENERLADEAAGLREDVERTNRSERKPWGEGEMQQVGRCDGEEQKRFKAREREESQGESPKNGRDTENPTLETPSARENACDGCISISTPTLTPMPDTTTAPSLSLGDDRTSCEYAAHIITSMRADVNPEEIRAELGCGGDVKELKCCTVNNGKLFSTVDRYTR